MKKTTTILTIALIASLAGNGLQYAATPQAEDTLTPNTPQTDEPGAQPDEQLVEWQVRATFAITYQVKPKSSAFSDGYTVTVYNTDHTPTTVRSKKKPDEKAVTWSPIPEDLPGVISVEVHHLEVTGGKSDEE